MTRDLVILAADKNALYALEGFFTRTGQLGIRGLNIERGDIISHPAHDPGVVREASDFLRPYLRTHKHALICFDYEGCGKKESPDSLETDMEKSLYRNGWKDRAAVVAFEPEIERWLWNGSSKFAKVLKQPGYADLRLKLESAGFAFDSNGKPERPKEAFEQSLRLARMPRSSVLYKHLAQELSFSRCTERSFLKLLQTMRTWFPVVSTR